MLMRGYLSTLLLTFLFLFAVIVFFKKKNFVAPLLVFLIPLIIIDFYLQNPVKSPGLGIDKSLKQAHLSIAIKEKSLEESLPKNCSPVIHNMDTLIYLDNEEFENLSNDELVKLKIQKKLKTKPYTGKSLCQHGNGQTRELGYYTRGKQSGKWTYWYEDGQIEKEGNFISNHKDGNWNYWFESGDIRKIENYTDFELIETYYGQKNLSPLNRVITFRISKMRDGFNSYRNRSGSSIDQYKTYHNFSDLIKYFPRALQIGFLSPFPSNWLKEGFAVGTIGYILAGLEMIIWYFVLLGFIYITYKNPSVIKPLSVVFLVSILLIVLLAYVVPNVGAIYRMRQGYMIPFYLIGAHGLSVMISNFTKIQHK
jgi:antitoxin component YwqK of YwqJK toxin-antitoxin module